MERPASLGEEDTSFFSDHGAAVSVDDPDSEALLKLLENSSAEEEDVLASQSAFEDPDAADLVLSADPPPEAPVQAPVLAPAAPPPAPVPAPPVYRPPVRESAPAPQRKPERGPEARFEEQLEQLLGSFREQALAEWAESEQDLRSKYRAAMDADQLHFEAKMAEKAAEIADLRRQNEALTLALDLKRTQGKRFGAFGFRVQKKGDMFRCVGRAFQRWRLGLDLLRGEKVKASMSTQWYVARLLGRALGSWRRDATGQAKERALASLRAQWQTEKTQLVALSDLNRQRDVEEIARLQKALDEEARGKRQLQDDLKSVFMRGVCTLNFEAMQLLSGEPGTAPAVPPAPAAPAPPAPAPPAPAPPAEEPSDLEDVRVDAFEEPPPAAPEPEEAGSPGVEAFSAALQSARKEAPEPLASVENKPPARFQEPVAAAPRVVNAREAVKWQSAAGASIPVMSVIRPERRK